VVQAATGVVAGGLSVITAPGGVGTSGSSSTITGFPSSITLIVTNNLHVADSTANQGLTDCTNLYNFAQAQKAVNCTKTFGFTTDIGGWNFTAGTYCFSASVIVSSSVALIGSFNPFEKWVFVIGDALTTYPKVTIAHVNCAYIRCGFQTLFQITGVTTLGPGGMYAGNFVGLGPVYVQQDTQVNGKVCSNTDTVYLDSATINYSVVPYFNSTWNITAQNTTSTCTFNAAKAVTTTSLTFANSTIVISTQQSLVCKDCITFDAFVGTVFNNTEICGNRTANQYYSIGDCLNPNLHVDRHKMVLLNWPPLPGQCLFDCKICFTLNGNVSCNFKCYNVVERPVGAEPFDLHFEDWWWVLLIFAAILAFIIWMGWTKPMMQYFYSKTSTTKKEKKKTNKSKSALEQQQQQSAQMNASDDNGDYEKANEEEEDV